MEEDRAWSPVSIIDLPHGCTTPSYVALGEAAKNQIAMNPTKTVFNVKHLIGRHFSDPSIQSGMKLWPFKVIAGPGDKPMIVVQYKGEEKQFSTEEISSMSPAEEEEAPTPAPVSPPSASPFSAHVDTPSTPWPPPRWILPTPRATRITILPSFHPPAALLLAVLSLLFASATVRPDVHFHPCNTFLI